MAARAGPPALLLLVASVWVALSAPAAGDSFHQLFQPFCAQGFDPAQGLMRWSNPVTWATVGFVPPPAPAGTSTGLVSSTSTGIGSILEQNPTLPIPGVGALAGANVTIPCSVGILLDVPGISLTLLDVRGLLMVEDPTDKQVQYSVNATWVVVRGNLVIGTAARHFRSKITFTLFPNPNNNRTGLTLTSPVIPFPNTTAIENGTAGIGHKAFAVVGGRVSMRGMPGGAASPSWVKLKANINAGDASLQVDQDVSSFWPINSTIVVASTSYDPQEAEAVTIDAYLSLPTGGTVILVRQKFQFNHWGNPLGLPDGFGGFVDQCAEVALLSRNIVIQGSEEPAPYRYIGGHFMVAQTNSAQVLHGVNFNLMGQQGTLGRYPVHFHVCADTGERSTVLKNSVTNSLQRCFVNHASHNLTFDSNVAYNTTGHCFLFEEGGEQDNTWVNNVCILAIKPLTLIPGGETDGEPSMYWVTTLNNDVINNVAAGSMGTGMWTEMKGSVRGMSASISNLKSIRPLLTSKGTVSGMVLHSNYVQGFRTYPSGVRPMGGAVVDTDGNPTDPESDDISLGDQANDGVIDGITFSGFNVYKHRWLGIFYQGTFGVNTANCTFSDNLYGLFIQSDTSGRVTNNRFVGYTDNVGTAPTLEACNSKTFGWRACAPVSGCEWPIRQRSNVRHLGMYYAQGTSNTWRTPQAGIFMLGIGYWSANSGNARFINNKFSGYNGTCRPASAVITAYPMNGGDWWDAASGFQGTQLAPGTPPIWFPNATYVTQNETFVYRSNGAATTDYVLQDKDGSVVGGTGGYLTANHPFLVPPPSMPQCTPIPLGNGQSCPGICYRTVYFDYDENTTSNPNSTADTWTYPTGVLSTITLVRDEDGISRDHDGLRVYAASQNGTRLRRAFYFNLVANTTYSLYVNPPDGNPGFWPASLRVFYKDGWDGQKPCRGQVSVRVMPRSPTAGQWAVPAQDLGYWKPCPGSGGVTKWPVRYEASCTPALYTTVVVTLSTFLPRQTAFTLVATDAVPQSCSPTDAPLCGVLASGDTYTYNVTGAEQRVVPPPRVGYQLPGFNDATWRQGSAVIGYLGNGGIGPYIDPASRTVAVTKGRTTYYFRETFTLASPACFPTLNLEVYPSAGLLVFLNGLEILRLNMPAGPTNASTLSLGPGTVSKTPSFVTYPVQLDNTGSGTRPALNVGVNLLAYETHAASLTTSSVYFDSRVSLVNLCST